MSARNRMLVLMLIALGVVAGGLALDLHPARWLGLERSTAQSPQGADAGHPTAAPTTPASPASAPAAAASSPVAPALPPVQAPNYRAIVQQAGPAVVGVTGAGVHALGAEEAPLDLNDPFLQFFRGLPGLPFRLPGGKGLTVPFRSQGSGFIISSDGLVLTNAHVVREAKEVTVKLSDRREFRAKVLGEDAATDTAVLRIGARNLPTTRLGDASQLQVGDPVLAIGSPFGFEQTATQGIVSAKGRSLPGESAVPYIQTDAAVNPGSSGGPLFDAAGNVVGINAQIFSQSGGFQGLSFAVPIGVALRVKDQIVATGHASHARLGVSAQDLSQGLARSFGMARPDGALIASVQSGSAAASAGLQPGDVVTAVDGVAITHAGDLSSRIGMAAPGDTVKLTLWRAGAEKVLSVKLGQAEDSAQRSPRPKEDRQSLQLGLNLRKLSPEELASARLQGGLYIEQVDGPAARAGVEPGDVLLSINGVAVRSVEQVQRELDKKNPTVALLIWRDGNRVFIPVELG